MVQIFSRRFFLLPAGNEEVQGRSESNPVVLPPPIAAEDFGNFVKVIYSQCVFQLFSSAVIYLPHY